MATRVDPPLAQQQFGQPVPDPHQIRAGILAGTHQITHRLHLSFRNGDRGDLTKTQQPGQMRGITGVGLDPIPRRADQLRWRRYDTLDLGVGQCSRQSKARRSSLIGHPHRTSQSVQPVQDLAVIGTQTRPRDLTRFLIDSMRNHRKRMHIQPDTRTVETHRRPPDLQLWLYQCECSLDTGNPRPIAARGLRPQVASISSSPPMRSTIGSTGSPWRWSSGPTRNLRRSRPLSVGALAEAPDRCQLLAVAPRGEGDDHRRDTNSDGFGDLVGRDNLPGVAETPCKADPRCHLRSSRSRRQGSSALPLPRCRLCGLHQPWTRPAASRPGQARRVHRLAGLGTDPHRISHRLGEPHQHTRHVASTSARARRTDRTFILGSTTSPELKFMQPNMLHATHHSGEATPTP